MVRGGPIVGVTLIAMVAAQGALADGRETAGYRRAFDLEAHRGGMALRPENTLSAFGNALRIGVSTLELDVMVTKDGRAIVSHDRVVLAGKCRDTAPATPDDPEFPYVGKYVHTLTLRQLKTLDCGSQTPPEFPGQKAIPGARMPTLRQVFRLVRRYHAEDVKLNVEMKSEPAKPGRTATREQFVRVTAREIQRAGIQRQVTIQSFDWGSLIRMHKIAPKLPLVALDNRDFLQIGQSGKSPWLGGLDIDDFGGDPLEAIKSFGASVYSPVHGTPHNGKVTDPGYEPYVTKKIVARAHALRLKVIPWTVDDEPTWRKLIDDGVDGIITNHPDRLRTLLRQRGFALPKRYLPPTHRSKTILVR